MNKEPVCLGGEVDRKVSPGTAFAKREGRWYNKMVFGPLAQFGRAAAF